MTTAKRYIIKCDDCKRPIGQTEDLSESAAGGKCPECRGFIITRTVTIDKTPRGWSCQETTDYGAKYPAITVHGAKTLAWALLKSLKGLKTTKVQSITVNGNLMPFKQVLAILDRKWGGRYDYWFTDIKAALQS